MRRGIRLSVAGIVLLHAVISLIGVAAAFGWADTDDSSVPIRAVVGLGWLAAAALLAISGALLMTGPRRWWWMLGAASVVVSQSLIVTFWNDAEFGTAANIVLLGVVGFEFVSRGPRSYRAQYRRDAAEALARTTAAPVVTENDLDHLPRAVAGYLRQARTVGQPRVTDFRARFHGRIRASATGAWMTFTGDQVDTFGPESTRLFFMDATKLGMPMDILHTFVGPNARMRVKACSVITVVDASGSVMDRAETVTLFNDLCVLAPAALVDAPVQWLSLDDRRVQGVFTRGEHSVTAILTFDADHQLIDFVSDDRSRASQDGTSFVPQRWSTPVHDYQTSDARRVATKGEARWHAAEPEGEFAYLEFEIDAITYNNGATAVVKSPNPVKGAVRTAI